MYRKSASKDIMFSNAREMLRKQRKKQEKQRKVRRAKLIYYGTIIPIILILISSILIFIITGIVPYWNVKPTGGQLLHHAISVLLLYVICVFLCLLLIKSFIIDWLYPKVIGKTVDFLRQQREIIDNENNLE